LDTDGDGKLSDAEKAAAQEAIRARILAQRSSRFDELDKDDDGLLTVDEFLGVPGIRPDLAARILKHLDTDKDGKISKEEFLAALRPPSPHGNGNGNGGAPPANPPAVPPAG
jgi:Ca2+-binding EF-hand superfamily protein